MKRALHFFIFFLFVCSLGHALSPDIQTIVTRGELRVAVLNQNEFPFFFMSRDGELVGSDIDLARNIAKELGVKVTFDRTYRTYDSVVKAVSNEKVDVAISDISKTLPRAKRVFFTTPYVTLHLGLAVNRKMLAKSEKEDIGVIAFINNEKLKVGALANSAYIPLTQKLFPECEVIPMSSNEEGFQAAEEKKIIAYLTQEFDLDKFIVDRPEKSIVIKTLLFKDLLDSIAMIVPTNRPQLLYFLNTYLEMRPPKYTPKKLFYKYHPLLKEGLNANSN